MTDLIDRRAILKHIEKIRQGVTMDDIRMASIIMNGMDMCEEAVTNQPSAQPEQPPYVAEIEAEYQKAVKMPHIHKPLAKALYEVWKKHDREDTERRADDQTDKGASC